MMIIVTYSLYIHTYIYIHTRTPQNPILSIKAPKLWSWLTVFWAAGMPNSELALKPRLELYPLPNPCRTPKPGFQEFQTWRAGEIDTQFEGPWKEPRDPPVLPQAREKGAQNPCIKRKKPCMTSCMFLTLGAYRHKDLIEPYRTL